MVGIFLVGTGFFFCVAVFTLGMELTQSRSQSKQGSFDVDIGTGHNADQSPVSSDKALNV
jgi:hypothetical protein